MCRLSGELNGTSTRFILQCPQTRVKPVCLCMNTCEHTPQSCDWENGFSYTSLLSLRVRSNSFNINHFEKINFNSQIE
uniref:Uncharacterized protein n=1 Tax=Anguilla anguilla TaxID=7936 RepID=A0A0E9WQ24_ANGAN